MAGSLLGAARLLISEFTTLYKVQLSASGAPINSISTGSHDSYALIPIALMVAILTLGAGVLGSRLSLLAVGALKVVTLVIARRRRRLWPLLAGPAPIRARPTTGQAAGSES